MSLRRLVLALIGVAACSSDSPETPATPVLADRITWTQATTADHQPVAVLPAEVVSDTAGEAHLGPGIDGRILRWAVGPGARVAHGTPLATVESAELTTLAADVGQLRTAEKRATELLDLARAAQAAGVGTATEVARASATRADLSSRLSSARARLSARRGGVEGRGGAWVWTAPADGIVDAVTCAEGRVSAGDRCLRLMRTGGGTTVEVHVPERVLAAIDPVGPTVAGHWTGTRGEPVPLQFQAAAPALDPHTRQLRMRFSAPDGVRVGASGRVELQVPGEGLLRVPTAAIVRVGGAPHLFVDQPGADATPVPADTPVAWLTPVSVSGTSGTDTILQLPTPVDIPPRVATRGTFLLKSLALREAP